MVTAARRPMLFTEFCDAMGIVLEQGQRVLALVAFDGLEPRDLKGEERELARLIFGPDVEVVPPLARAIVVIVCGARAGKSYLASIRVLHLAMTVPLDGIAPGQRPSANITAPDLALADEDIRYIRGAIRNSPKLLAAAVSGHEEDSKALEIVMRRGKRMVSISARAASSRGKTGRGRTLPAFLIDEAALFRDVDHAISDVDAFKALSPRVMPQGQGLIPSTPWAEEGLLFDLFTANWNKPDTCLVAHAPTRLMRTDANILAQVEREERRDPENARREFGAEFVSTGQRQFFDGPALAKTFVDELPPLDPAKPCEMAFGADFGFSRNSSTLVGGPIQGGVHRLVALEERRPEPGQPLVPSEVCADFADTVAAHEGGEVAADGHYAESVREHLGERGIDLIAASTDKPGMHVAVRSKMREGKVLVSKKHPLADRLLKQLRAVKSRALAGGSLSISSPLAADGSHGDLASAFVVWASQEQGTRIEAASPHQATVAENTNAWLKSMREQRFKPKDPDEPDLPVEQWAGGSDDLDWCQP